MCAFICVALFVWVGITFLPLYSLASVLCTCISMMMDCLEFIFPTHAHSTATHVVSTGAKDTGTALRWKQALQKLSLSGQGMPEQNGAVASSITQPSTSCPR